MSFGIFSYLVYMAVFCWLPLAYLWIRYRKVVSKYKTPVMKLLTASILLIYVPWDNLAVYFDVWSYPPEKNLGVYLLFSPLETLLFSVSVVLAISFVTILLYEKQK